MLKEYLKIRNYIKIKWKYFFIGIIFLFLSVSLNSISLTTIIPLMDRILSRRKIILPQNFPYFISIKLEPIISKLNSYHPLVILKYLIFFMIFAFFLKGLFFYFNNYFFKLFSSRVLTDLREKIYTKFLNLSLDFFIKRQTGELTTRIIYDVGVLNNAIESFFPQFVFPFFLVISYLFIIFIIDWKLSLISIFIYPVILIPVFNLSKKLRKLGKKIQEAYGRIANIINESIFGQKIIKAYNQEGNFIQKFKNDNENIFKIIMSINRRVLLITPFIEFSGVLASSYLIYYGGIKIIEGAISPGFLFLFFFSLFSIISPLKTIINTYAHLKQSSSALPRIFSILDYQEKTKSEGKKFFKGLKEKIEFKNIFFAYEKKLILKNINLVIKKGEKIGIVGKTGSGKSTLTGLILRFYDPVSGEILIDGEDIRNYKIDSLRKYIGYVPQEPIIFYGTIKDNITFGNYDEKRFEEVIEMAGIRDFINSFPEKENTFIGEKGENLSGGQKQLISIARAIYKNPDILIFDEATASLDSESEKIVQLAMERIMEEKTVLIVAHRLSTIRFTTKIIVLQDGEIVEEGTHEELYEKKGIYFKFLKLQQI
ncbi:MAG: ABC transporter ATP-binding protein [Candidatus Ratteibacteria bacterium]